MSAPPNPAEDEPARATSAAEVPTLPVETKLAGCSPAETIVATQPAMTQETGAALDANRTCVQLVEQAEELTDVGADGGHEEPPAPSAASPTRQRFAAARGPQVRVQSARRAARGGLPVLAPSESTAQGRGILGAATLGCAPPRAPVMKLFYTQRSSGSCWIQRTWRPGATSELGAQQTAVTKAAHQARQRRMFLASARTERRTNYMAWLRCPKRHRTLGKAEPQAPHLMNAGRP